MGERAREKETESERDREKEIVREARKWGMVESALV